MPEVVTTLAGWRARCDGLRREGRSLGLTMTMGALHAGHASLFERAASGRATPRSRRSSSTRSSSATPTTSRRYPRDLDADVALAGCAGVELVLAPSVEEVWPSWPAATATTVHVAGLADGLEDEGRPGHFDGVAGVVTKLLIATGTCAAYFGEKDYQQLCVVRRLVADLALPVAVVGCPIVREPDGLALSSRNVRLSPAGRAAALALPRSIEAGCRAVADGRGVDRALADDARRRRRRAARHPGLRCGRGALDAARSGRARAGRVAPAPRRRGRRGGPAHRQRRGRRRPDPVSLDTLVVGSGVAGLSVAVRLADAGVKVGVVTKAALSETTTRWAQGGVAAVLHDDEDSTDLHLADTLRAGAGLCDVDAVRVLVDEGPARVEELIALGAVFDREATGALQRAREGGHSHARILHAGGAATGAEVERALVAATQGTVSEIREHAVAVGLLVEDGACHGIAIRDAGGRHELESASVVLATGGAGQLFEVTTNPSAATGDGLAIALRAGVPVVRRRVHAVPPDRAAPPSDAAPTALRGLRGHGALLRNASGRALRRRARAARRGEPRHGRRDGARRREPPLARRDGARGVRRAGSRRCRAASRRLGSTPRSTGSRSLRRPTTSRAGS